MIKSSVIGKWVAYLFPVFLITLFFGVYEVGKILDTRPTSVHVWRQTDCASLAYMYYAKDISILEPEMHNYISYGGTSGKTAGEFTGLYWFMGKLYSWFGFHEGIYRLVGVILFLLALWAVFDLVKGLTKSATWGVIVSGFLATSPVLVFYSSAFLTNVPALSFVLIGWWAFWRFSRRKNFLFLVLAAVCFALAALLKITALVSVIALVGWWVLERIRWTDKWLGTKKLPSSWGVLVAIACVFAAVYGWYAYVESYVNTNSLGKYTFNDVWPIWEMDSESLHKAYSFAVDLIVYQLTSPVWWCIVVISTLVLLLFGWKKHARFMLFLLATGIGFILYLSMWFNALDGHDYYVINLLIFPAMVLTGLAVFSGMWMNYAQNILKGMLVIALIWNVGYASNNFKMRYWPEFGKTVENSEYFGKGIEVGYWRYFGEHRDYDVYHDLESALEGWGIDDSSIVISLPDPSFCISLYLMNREGFSGMSCPIEQSAIRDRINKGASYLIVNDSLMSNQLELASFKNHLVGTHGALSVYDLTK